MLGGEGSMAIAVMWAMTGFSLIVVALRLYTRICIIESVGADDHVFCLSWVFLLLYTAFLTVSAFYGFGQNITDLTLDSAVLAVKWEMVGQTFAVLGMAIAKISLGLFLLRIVVQPWHKVAIWLAMGSLLAVSVMTAIIFWIQCLPPTSIFDPRVKGRCIIQVTPYSILLGSWCAFVDFFFAGFPWLFIWRLNMRYKEKLTIALSMSVGVIAGVCGILRTVELGGLSSKNYTKDTVSLIIWSAAEIAVTMVCISFTVLRPFYLRIFQQLSSFRSSSYQKQSNSADIQLGRGARAVNLSEPDDRIYKGPKANLKRTTTNAARASLSDEEMLRSDTWPFDPHQDSIQVKRDVTVEIHTR